MSVNTHQITNVTPKTNPNPIQSMMNSLIDVHYALGHVGDHIVD
jgi:hypothetical protein